MRISSFFTHESKRRVHSLENEAAPRLMIQQEYLHRVAFMKSNM